MNFREKLKTSQNNLNDVGKVLDNTTHKIYLSNLALEDLRNRVNVLKESTNALKANATHLQESNVEGKNRWWFKRFLLRVILFE
jgi:hypothetical protein